MSWLARRRRDRGRFISSPDRRRCFSSPAGRLNGGGYCGRNEGGRRWRIIVSPWKTRRSSAPCSRPSFQLPTTHISSFHLPTSYRYMSPVAQYFHPILLVGGYTQRQSISRETTRRSRGEVHPA